MNENEILTPKPLSDKQVGFFLHQGYLIVENLLNDDECQEILDDAIKITRNDYHFKGNFPTISPKEPEQNILNKVLCIHQPHHCSPIINKYISHKFISGALSQIVGAHLPFWDRSVKCMQSMYFLKPPGYQGQAWHQDEIYIPTRDRSLTGAWIALEDAKQENGCLWILPKSHQSGRLYDQKPHLHRDEFDTSEESYGFDDLDEIPVEVKKGSVVFFNGYLLHRSKKNRSNHSRKVLVNHYMTASSLLPWASGIAKEDSRKIQLVSGRDPYAYRGTIRLEEIFFRQCEMSEKFYDDE